MESIRTCMHRMRDTEYGTPNTETVTITQKKLLIETLVPDFGYITRVGLI